MSLFVGRVASRQVYELLTQEKFKDYIRHHNFYFFVGNIEQWCCDSICSKCCQTRISQTRSLSCRQFFIDKNRPLNKFNTSPATQDWRTSHWNLHLLPTPITATSDCSRQDINYISNTFRGRFQLVMSTLFIRIKLVVSKNKVADHIITMNLLWKTKLYKQHN